MAHPAVLRLVALSTLLTLSGCGQKSGSLAPLLLPPAPSAHQIALLAGSTATAGNLNGTTAQALFQHPNSAVTDSKGNIFVTDSLNNSIRKITPDGQVSLFAGGVQGNKDGTGIAAQFSDPTAISIDARDNLYVADTNNNSIRMITPQGIVSTLAGGSSSGNSDGTVSEITDAQGNIQSISNNISFNHPQGVLSVTLNPNTSSPISVLYVSDTGNHSIRLLAPAACPTTSQSNSGTSQTSAPSACLNSQTLSLSIPGTYTSLSLGSPMGMIINPGQSNLGNGLNSSIVLLVADSANQKIYSIFCFGINNYCSAPSDTNQQPSNAWSSLAIVNGTFYASDSIHDVIDQFSIAYNTNSGIPSDQTLTLGPTVIGQSGNAGARDGSNTQALFNAPTGIATTSANQLLIMDTGNNMLRLWNPATAMTSTLAGQAPVIGIQNGTANAAMFSDPTQIAVDAQGTAYIADTNNNCIRTVSSTGVVSTLAGQCGAAGGFADGPASKASFNAPAGIAVASNGTVFVADSNNDDIRVIKSGNVSTLAGMGFSAYVDAQGTAAAFGHPTGLALDAAGTLYVADTGSNSIRTVAPNGVVQTFAGTGSGTGAFADGPNQSAQFNAPSALAFDHQYNLYVIDTGNNAIRKISQGSVTTLNSGLSGYVDGPIANARFNLPEQLAIDQQGNIYVADTANALIRKISASGTVSTLAGTSGMNGMTLGNLPGTLAAPKGLAITPQGYLLFTAGNGIFQLE